MLTNDTIAAAYAQHAGRLRRYLIGRVGDVDVAEDLLSEVFARACEATGSYEDRGWQILSWLYRVAHNRAIDYRRQRARRGPPASLSPWHMRDDAPDERIIARMDLNDLLSAARLTPDQSRIIALRFVLGYDLQETAAQIGRTIGATKALQHRTLAKIAAAEEEAAQCAEARQ